MMARKIDRIRRLGRLLFAGMFFALLAAPAVVQVGHLEDNPKKARGGTLWLALFPERPRSLEALVRYPHALETYLTDHIGLRKAMLKANSQIYLGLFGESASRRVAFGRNGRLFMTAHDGAPPYSLIHDVCGVDVPFQAEEKVARAVAAALDHARAAGGDAVFAMIPTAPALYREELPPWLAHRCAGVPLAGKAMAILAGDAAHRDRVLYPLDQMLALKRIMDVIPKPNFHWAGAAPKRVVEHVVERGLNRPRSFDMPTRRRTFASDLEDLTPGLNLTYEEDEADPAAAAVERCSGAPCFPELGGVADALWARRYRSPRAGEGLLLVIGDSYLDASDVWFAEYYADVISLSTNNLRYLSAEQRRRVRDMIDGLSPAAVVLLYHDGNLLHIPEQITDPLWGDR